MSLIDLAYVQVDYNTKMPINSTAYALWEGCQLLGIETKFYSFLADIRKDLRKETLVHGWIGHVKGALQALGCELPNVPDAPECLLPFFGRKIWYTTMGDIRSRGTSVPVFIKPRTHQKAFTGHIASGEIRDLIRTASFDNDLEIMASDPVNFVSEYRIMVHHGMMVAARHYNGDFTLMPDMSVATKAIQAFEGAPCAYSLDLGLTDDGRSLIVEINDAFSLGAYGTHAIVYASMIVDRWCEMASLTSFD